MRRLTASVLLLASLLAACGGGGVPPAVPLRAELVFLAGPGTTHLVVDAGDGSLVARLPAGALVERPTAGGDLGEAYLVGSQAQGGVRRVAAGRPLSVTPIAPGPPSGEGEAALADAPGLTGFAGARTVLVVRWPDGSLHGYQAGRPLWSRPAGSAEALVAAGTAAAIRVGPGRWAALVPESGAAGPALVCDPGPAGDLDGLPLFACDAGGGSTLGPAPGPRRPAAGRGAAWGLAGVGAADRWVIRSDGTVCHLDAAGASCRAGTPGSGRPALAPDASLLAVAAGPGVEAAPPVAGTPVRSYRGGPYTSVAFSRDGAFLYAGSAARLDVFRVATRVLVASHPVDASAIELVVGG